MFLSGVTGSSGTLASSGKDREAAEIDLENLLAWGAATEDLLKIKFKSVQDMLDGFEADAQDEAVALAGRTEKYTVVTKLAPYVFNQEFAIT